MDYTGKIINHKTYGAGTVTAFYSQNRKIWVQFKGQSPKPYNIPGDFDAGFLSTDDQDLLDYIAEFKKGPLYRSSLVWGRQTVNKDINKVYRECCEILDDCGVKYGKVIGLQVATESIYKTYKLGCCIKKKDGFVIEMARELLEDSAYDEDLYDVMIHELVHTCEGTRGHNKTWLDHIKKVRQRYGFELLTRGGISMIMRYIPLIRIAPLNGKGII